MQLNIAGYILPLVIVVLCLYGAVRMLAYGWRNRHVDDDVWFVVFVVLIGAVALIAGAVWTAVAS